MKNLLFCTLLLSLSATSSAHVIMSANAIIPFNNSLQEEYSLTSPTTPSSSSYTFIEDRFGNPNKAVQLNTILDYGNPDFARMGSSDFTIAFWFRKDGSLWAEKSILQKRFVDVSDPSNVLHEEYRVFYNDVAGNSAQIRFKPFNDSAIVNSTFGFIEDSIWRHFAIVFDRSDSMSVYLDGQLYDSKYIGNTEQYECNIDSAVLEVGNGNISLDDLYFFDYALNPSEVDEIYNYQYATVECLCPGYWDLVIYPNPSITGSFSILLPDPMLEGASVQLFDMLGKLVPIEIEMDNYGMTVSMKNYAVGMYTVKITTTEGVLTRRIELI